jgi:cysteine-S-conjugate beta-lyase
MFGTVSAAQGTLRRLKAYHGEMGLCAGPDDINLAVRGLRTLAVRLQRHGESALTVARYLQDRPEVRQVMHPALESDPGHALWKRDFLGSSGLFSIVMEPGTDRQVAAFLDGLKLFGLGYSWGGFESLAIPFDARHYRSATEHEPAGPTIRLHIGLEDVSDLLADLASGLDRYRAAA